MILYIWLDQYYINLRSRRKTKFLRHSLSFVLLTHSWGSNIVPLLYNILLDQLDIIINLNTTLFQHYNKWTFAFKFNSYLLASQILLWRRWKSSDMQLTVDPVKRKCSVISASLEIFILVLGTFLSFAPNILMLVSLLLHKEISRIFKIFI